jgi:hypothetical protein
MIFLRPKLRGAVDLGGRYLGSMKLAEALALPADAARRAEQLRARIAASARYQEGETPAEDAAALLTEAEQILGELESLIRRINRTNAATLVERRGPSRLIYENRNSRTAMSRTGD